MYCTHLPRLFQTNAIGPYKTRPIQVRFFQQICVKITVIQTGLKLSIAFVGMSWYVQGLQIQVDLFCCFTVAVSVSQRFIAFRHIETPQALVQSWRIVKSLTSKRVGRDKMRYEIFSHYPFRIFCSMFVVPYVCFMSTWSTTSAM